MGEFLNAILLGVVQGLTEFLPVSSSGHLVILKNFLGMEEAGILFEVAVHLGTLMSIVTIYFSFIKRFFDGALGGFKSKKMNNSIRLIFLIFVATLPAAFVGLLFKDFIESLFQSTSVVGICLILTGSMLFIAQKVTKKSPKDEEAEVSTASLTRNLDLNIAEGISFKHALIMGCAQAVAILPGISRSGSTIAGGLLSGLNRNHAAAFSFMMSVPAVLGAVILQVRHIQEIPESQIWILICGVLTSYFVGLAGLYAVLKVVNKGRMDLFSYYLWTVGTLTLIFI